MKKWMCFAPVRQMVFSFQFLILATLLCFPILVRAQCFPDRHNTSWSAAWMSCETASNPNENRGQSHWAYYDFGKVYALADMKIWNLNEPDHRGSGMRAFEIDYSLDGLSWVHLGSFEIDQAPGTSTYEGEVITDWEGLQARYVIITPISNYGGQCMGFSEIRFNLDDEQYATAANLESQIECLTVSTYPNPYVDHFTLEVDSDCVEPIRYNMTNVLGQSVMAHTFPSSGGGQKLEIRTDHLPAGNYILHVIQGDNYLTKSLIKLNR